MCPGVGRPLGWAAVSRQLGDGWSAAAADGDEEDRAGAEQSGQGSCCASQSPAEVAVALALPAPLREESVQLLLCVRLRIPPVHSLHFIRAPSSGGCHPAGSSAFQVMAPLLHRMDGGHPVVGGRGAGTDAGSRRIHTGAGLYWEYRGGRHAPGCIIVLQQNNRPPLLYSPCTWEEDVKEGLLGRAIARRCPLGRGCGSLVGAGDNGPGTGVVLGAMYLIMAIASGLQIWDIYHIQCIRVW